MPEINTFYNRNAESFTRSETYYNINGRKSAFFFPNFGVSICNNLS